MIPGLSTIPIYLTEIIGNKLAPVKGIKKELKERRAGDSDGAASRAQSTPTISASVIAR